MKLLKPLSGASKLDLTGYLMAVASVAMLLQPTLLSNIVQAITDDNMRANKIGAQLLVPSNHWTGCWYFEYDFCRSASQGISADVRESAHQNSNIFIFKY